MPRPLLRVDDLCAWLEELGARPVHVRRLLRAWLAGRPLASAEGCRAVDLPERLRARLAEVEARLQALAVELEREPGADGSSRSLLRLASGRTVERVRLPREGLCVSTQVGCAVGCRFCKTGEDGLVAQLSALEVLAQVATARRDQAVRRVVFMGMGEPLHNLAAVLDALAALGQEGGLPHKSLVVSTVGEPAGFARLLASPVRPALALSLHTLERGLREDLLPRAPRLEPRELYAAAQDYADATGHPLLVQWTLLEGVNDGLGEARALARLLAGRRAIVNYIPFNAVEGSGWKRPAVERCAALVELLRSAGVLATLRHSAGQDVLAGCGQLRARAASPSGPA